MIIDTFIFNDKIDLLEIRLDLLYDIVDYFILVESNYTFKGNKKILYYTENKDKFNKYNDKIIVIENNSIEYQNISHDDGNFLRENFSRNIINDKLKKMNLNDNDIILHSDLDEIPNPNFLKLLKKNKYNFTILSIKLELYYYNFETKSNYDWYGTFVMYYKYIEKPLSYYRERRNILKWNINICIDEPNIFGWHFSFFGDYSVIKNKLLSFSEPTNLSLSVINNKDYLYSLIKNKKLWFNIPGEIKYINFVENNNLIKTNKIKQFHKKLQNLE